MPENEKQSITERARKIALAAMAESTSLVSPSIDEILEANPDIATEVKRQLKLLGFVKTATEKDKSVVEEDSDQSAFETTRVISDLDTGYEFHNQPTLARCPNCRQQLPTVEFSEEEYSHRITCENCENSVLLLNNRRRLHTGSKIAHFELVSPLGAGSFGLVWKVWDTKLQRHVALKIPRRGLLTGEQQDLFLREARVAAAIRHPHVVAIHDTGVDRGTVYICSDLIDGTTLAQWHRESCDSPMAAAVMMQKIAMALQAIHECSVIHRDLKPSNVMVDSKNDPQVMDFGLAKQDVFEATMTLSGEVMGTPAYMSPEAAKGESRSSDPRTDIYSMGVMLYELLTGELPFRGDFTQLVQQILHAKPRSPVDINPTTPSVLETICLKCMEKDPRDRYQTARELAEDLSRFATGNTILARPQTFSKRLLRTTQSHPWMTVTAISFAITTIMLPLALSMAVKHQTDATNAREEVKNANKAASSARKEVKDANKTASSVIAELERSQAVKNYKITIDQSADMIFSQPLESMRTAIETAKTIQLDSSLKPGNQTKLLTQLQQTLQDSLRTLGGEPIKIKGAVIDSVQSPTNGNFAFLTKTSNAQPPVGSRFTRKLMHTTIDATEITANSKPVSKIAYHPTTTVNQIEIDPTGEYVLTYNSDLGNPDAAMATRLSQSFGKISQGIIPHAIASSCFPTWSTDLWIVDATGMVTCWPTGVEGKLNPKHNLATTLPVKRIHALPSAGQLVTESEQGIQLWNVQVGENIANSLPLAGPTCKFVPFLPRTRLRTDPIPETTAGWWNRQTNELVLETWQIGSFDKRERWTASLPKVDDIGACYHSEDQEWLCANLIANGVGSWHWWSLTKPDTQAQSIPLAGDPQMGIEVSPEEKDIIVGSRKRLSQFRVTAGTLLLHQSFLANDKNIETFAWLGNSHRIAVAYGNEVHVHQLHEAHHPASAVQRERREISDSTILLGRDSPITRIFSGSDGQAIVTLDTDSRMRKWVISEPNHDSLFELGSATGEATNPIPKVQIHDTGKIALALDSNGLLTVWNTQRIRNFFSNWYVVKQQTSIAHATLQGSTLAIASEDGKVDVFSVSTNGFLSDKYQTTSQVKFLQISENERWLCLLGNGDSSMVDLSQPNDTPWKLPEPGNPIAAAFIGEGSNLLTINENKECKVWNPKERTSTTPESDLVNKCTGTLVPGKKAVMYPFEFGNITLLQPSPQGGYICKNSQFHRRSEQMHFVQSDDGEHLLAEVKPKKETLGGAVVTKFGKTADIAKFPFWDSLDPPPPSSTTSGVNNLLAISPDNRCLIRSGIAGFHAWYFPESRLEYFPNVDLSTDAATQLLFSPDGQWLIVGHNSGMIRLWPISENAVHPTPIEFDLHKSPITSIAVDPLSRWCLFSSNDKICRMPLDIKILQEQANKRFRIESVLPPAKATQGSGPKKSAPATP
jgi:serine/threonine protein kinase/WD40 repeat protein